MKRFALLALIILSAFCASAQTSKLIYKYQDPSTGHRSLGTSYTIVRTGMTDRHPLKISLLARESADGWQYSIEISINEIISRAVPQGAIMLLRTKSGEVLELKNSLNEAQSRDVVGEWIQGTANKTYDNKASYPVTLGQLQAISAGVSKVRLQLNGEYFDSDYKKDKFGSAVKDQLFVIEEYINTGGGLRQGF